MPRSFSFGDELLQQLLPVPPDDQVDENLVIWHEGDRENPQNFSVARKCFITFQLSMLALAASLGSSIIAPATDAFAADLGVSSEVAVLSVSLYILGFAFGPLCWAPISEIWGRKIGILPAMFCLGLFSIGSATSRNAPSIFITRFFCGIFGSAPVSIVAASLGDIWNQQARGIAMTFYSVAVVGGPTLGPTIGAALVVNQKLGWRWTEYIEAIWVFTVCTLTLFCMPELYAPVLLKRKAQKLRRETSNRAWYHPHENIKLDFKSIVTKQLSRPLIMLFTEPMVACIALYASFVYGILYLTLEMFKIVFSELRHFSPVVATLPFLSLFVGVLFAVVINLGNQPYYVRKSREAQGQPVPEARLPPMAVGGLLFTTGLFWFAWTAEPSFSWTLPVVAAAFIGAGFNIIFQQCINYLVDTYGLYSASATAANTFLRSILAAAFPLVAKPMFHNLGVGPATSILGAFAAAALPIPFIFLRYGVALRKKSRFAPAKGTKHCEGGLDQVKPVDLPIYNIYHRSTEEVAQLRPAILSPAEPTSFVPLPTYLRSARGVHLFHSQRTI